MGKINITAGQVVRSVLIGLVVLFALTQIINFGAINTDDPNAEIFKPDVNYNKLFTQVTGFVLAIIAIMIVWRFSGAIVPGQTTFSRKDYVTLIIFAGVLWALYSIVAQTAGLPPLTFSAYQLQAVIKP